MLWPKYLYEVVSFIYNLDNLGDVWFYDFGDSNRAFKRDYTVCTGC